MEEDEDEIVLEGQPIRVGPYGPKEFIEAIRELLND